jgi:hypothetical protein
VSERESPCSHCPWRTENHGKPHPDGWYTAANRKRLWAKLRRGDAMSCHPTDPTNPVSAKAREQGAIVAKEESTPKECVGAVVLQQREVMCFQADHKGYFKTRKNGMTKRGLAVIVERVLMGGVLGTPAMLKPDLNAPVGHDGLSWDP